MSSITFQGYVRPNGKVGSRNLVAVIPSVICATDVAQGICRAVQGTVGFFHHQGCCQLPVDLKRVTDTLIGLGCSPNVGAALVVSLGCEGTDTERLVNEIAATGKPVEVLRIQELGGMSRAIQVGTDLAQKLAMEISGQQRETVDISQVVMAIKCGASDTTSGMASNCVIGYVADKLVDLGATVVFGETTEFLGGEHILARRAVGGEDGPVGRKIYEIVDRMEKRAAAIGEDMRGGQPTPGNIAGGLSSIEEKNLGAIVKSGHRPIQGVLEYPQMVTTEKGLWIKDAPGREPEILTGMAATGAQFMLFSTGRGAPQGFPSMPVIKVCGNPNTYARMQHDMDLNAGVIIEGRKSIDEVGEEAFALLLQVLNGRMTKNEAIHYISTMDIYCIGPVI
ncbi:MAG: UxaA family hydrolase [Lachnospiraceae bacterium]|nr:UxaA family hydrolase [Lachnospiraceae bacterium]